MASERVTPQEPPEPPKPPEVRRRMRFAPTQAIGLPIIALLPLLALFRLFDTRDATASVTSNELALEVSYPSRLRYRTKRPLQVQIENRTGQALPKVELALSKDYIENFVRPDFHPSVDTATPEALHFELKDMQPGERRTITALLEVETAGKHAGHVEVSLDQKPPLRVSFETFVFP